MDLNDYQNLARKTAQYPGQGTITGLTYTALGLSGEAGETADQTKKILRDDNSVVTEVRMDKLKKEMGDTLWYLANMAWELGLTLNEVAEHNIAKLSDRQERGVIKGDGGS